MRSCPQEVSDASGGDVSNATDFRAYASKQFLGVVLEGHVEDRVQAFSFGLVHCVNAQWNRLVIG